MKRCCFIVAILCWCLAVPSGLANDLYLRSGVLRVSTGRFETVKANNLYLVQFPRLISSSLRKQAERIGFLVHGYQHKNALVVRATRVVTKKELQAIGASGVVLLPIEAKIDRELLTGDARRKIKIHVMLWGRETTAFRSLSNVAQFAGIVISHFAQAQTEATRATILRLAANPDVMWIEPVRRVSLLNDDHRFSTQSMRVLAAPWCGTWPNTYNLSGHNISLAQFDGGAVDNHVGFADSLGNGRFTNVTTSGADGHATFVAGTIFGNGASSPNGLFELAGLAPKAKLYCGDYWTNPSGQQANLITSNAIVAANHSWGFWGQYDQSALQFDGMIHSTGSATVFGGGNEGVNNINWNTPIYASLRATGQAKNAITVGGVQENNATLRWINSSLGPTVDNGVKTRIKPDIVAISQRVASTTGLTGYGTSGGTSFSAPAVTGTIGLLAERYFYFRNNLAGFKADVAKAILIGSADDLGTPGPDYGTGYGRLNVYQAIRMLDGGLDPKVPSNSGQTTLQPKYYTWCVGSVSAGQTVKLSLNVALQPNTTAPLQDDVKITCVWTDWPQTGVSQVVLVNNLDLSLKDKFGVTHLPYVLAPGSLGTPAATGINSVDNVEQVSSRLGLGLHTIQVQGTNVPYGPQRFVIAVCAPTLDVQIKITLVPSL